MDQQFHPNLKFTHEKSKSSVNFLDVSVSIVANKLEIDLFCKTMDSHQFLHFNPAHPFRNKKNQLFTTRDCISKDFIHLHWLSKNTLKTWKLGFVTEDTHKKL